MKAILRYLSLLLYSGLIIPFYFYYQPGKSPYATKAVRSVVRSCKAAGKPNVNSFSLVDDVAANFFPLLKKLN